MDDLLKRLARDTGQNPDEWEPAVELYRRAGWTDEQIEQVGHLGPADARNLLTVAAAYPSATEVREAIGLLLAHYQVGTRLRDRRDAQTIALAEILRWMDGHPQEMITGLKASGYVPLTLDDLPRRLGGPPDATEPSATS